MKVNTHGEYVLEKGISVTEWWVQSQIYSDLMK